jgi:hypothetical protein
MPTPTSKPKAPGNLASQVRNEEMIRKTGKQGKCGDVVVSNISSVLFGVSDLFFLQEVMCDMCVSRKELCVYGSRVACKI